MLAVEGEIPRPGQHSGRRIGDQRPQTQPGTAAPPTEQVEHDIESRDSRLAQQGREDAFESGPVRRELDRPVRGDPWKGMGLTLGTELRGSTCSNSTPPPVIARRRPLPARQPA